MRYTLKNGRSRAKVDTHGGEMISFRHGGVPCGWEGDGAYWSERAPVLFPIVGGLRGGTVLFDGKPYSMPKHGFAKDMEFVAGPVSVDTAEFTLESSPETLLQYPHPFRLTVRHKLGNGGFQTSYRVRNLGDAPMPFCIGGHPGFYCPLGADGAFEDYELVYPQDEDADPLLPTPDGLIGRQRAFGLLSGSDRLPLRYALFDSDALVFDRLKSRSVRLVNRRSGNGISFHFEGFPVLGVWTPAKKRAPFICLEPWLGLPALEDESGLFRDKPYAVTLSPGEALELSYSADIV